MPTLQEAEALLPRLTPGEKAQVLQWGARDLGGNFPFPVVEEFRRLGNDVLTVLETENAGQAWPDETILAFATGEQRALLTLNRKHFFRLHRLEPRHTGSIACTFDANFISLAERIDAAISALSSLSGQLLRINRPG
jgi:hypothetical protein